jgi:hypothetical protein
MSQHTEHDTTRVPDEGSAMILAVLVMALLAVLTTTILGVSVNNLGATRRTQDSARALDAADAGLTQAVAHLRSSGRRGLACSPTCTTNPWGSSTTPMSQPVVGSTDQRWQAWIAPLPSSSARELRYRVTSRGLAGTGQRVVQADVALSLEPLGMPLGIFARSISGGGTPDLDGISIFTTGCVWNRTKLGFTSAPDAAYGIPTAVRSSRVITDSNGNGSSSCATNDNKRIHKTAADRCRGAGDPLRWDQDSLGGSCAELASLHPTYYKAQNLDADAANDVDGTYLQDDAALRDLFGIADDPLPPDKLDELRAVARAQGNYWTTTTYTVPQPDDHADSVMFFDLATAAPGSVVDLKALGDTWSQDGCQQRSLLIVIDGGNVRINGNSEIAASVVLTSKTYGEVDKGNGTPDFVGTIFANTVNLAGTIDLSLNACFLDNLSPSLYTAVVGDYRELDR